jgi:hypothetical protein
VCPNLSETNERNRVMDYELEVFEVYDDGEQPSSKRHSKHTRKKCKQKGKAVLNAQTNDDLSRSKSSVLSGERRPLGWRESILSVLGKLKVWRNQRRYQTAVPDKGDSPHSSKDFRRGYIPPSGEFRRNRETTGGQGFDSRFYLNDRSNC